MTLINAHAQIAESQVTNLMTDLSNLQPINTALTSIGNLVTAANEMLYTTAANTYAVTSITALGRSLLGGATTGAMQTTLSLVPGTNIQAYPLTGDVTTSGAAATLATVNSNTGSFGDASHTTTFTVNGKGLITAASSNAIQIAESQVTNLTTDLAARLIAANNLSDVANATTARGNLTAAKSGANTDITSVLLNQTGLAIKSATSNTLTIQPIDTYMGNSTLSISTNATNQTLTLNSNFTVSAGGALTLTTSGSTSLSLPTSGTLLNGSTGELTTTTINAQTGTTYTFSAADFISSLVTASNASASTYTVPNNATTSIAAGNKTRLLNLGAGVVTIAFQGGDTSQSGNNLTLKQGQICEIEKITSSTNSTWNIAGGTPTQPFSFSTYIPTGANTQFALALNMPFAGTITATTSECRSGTITATFKVNTTALGATNSVSTMRSIQAQTTNNTFNSGDDIFVSFASNSTALDITLTVQYTRSF
jgi:hypothetical protein